MSGEFTNGYKMCMINYLNLATCRQINEIFAYIKYIYQQRSISQRNKFEI